MRKNIIYRLLINLIRNRLSCVDVYIVFSFIDDYQIVFVVCLNNGPVASLFDFSDNALVNGTASILRGLWNWSSKLFHIGQSFVLQLKHIHRTFSLLPTHQSSPISFLIEIYPLKLSWLIEFAVRHKNQLLTSAILFGLSIIHLAIRCILTDFLKMPSSHDVLTHKIIFHLNFGCKWCKSKSILN